MTRSTVVTRRLLVAVGLLSLCAALIVLFVPSTTVILSWPWDGETLLVAFFTVVIIIVGLLGPLVLLDDPTHRDQSETTPEQIPSTPSPGYELEHILDRRWLVLFPPALAERERIRSQLREAAIQTIVRTSDCSVEFAHEKIEQGTWSDNQVATAFVRTEPASETIDLQSFVDRVCFSRRARRTAQAILRRSEQSEMPQW